MKHPALTRVLAVALAIVSVLTLISGAVSIGKTEQSHREDLRGEELLRDRIRRAEELSLQLEDGRPAYDSLSEELPDQQAGYQKDAAAYRQELATYTATQAGLVIGRAQLANAEGMLIMGRRQFEEGYAAFEEGAAAFDRVYGLYQSVRHGFDRGWAAYQSGLEELTEDGMEDQPDILQPEQILAILDAEKRTLAELKTLLDALREDTPSDQAETARLLRQLAGDLNDIAPQLEGLDAEHLAYRAGYALLDRAESLIRERTDEGMSQEDALAEADRLSREALGMSVGELKTWLEENEPPQTTTEGESFRLELSEEQMELLMDYLPSDRELMETALTLLEETEQDLDARERELRANPEAENLPELALALLRDNLTAGERLLALVEPAVLEGREQMDLLREQMEQGRRMLEMGQAGINGGYRQLDQTAQELSEQQKELRERRDELQDRRRTLDGQEQSVEDYETLLGDYRVVRSALMSYDGIYERVNEGGELIENAEAEYAAQQEAHERQYSARRLCSVLMLGAALCGILTVLAAFEKLKLKRLWLPLLPAIALATAGELWSIQMGRGLWYTALFLLVFGAALLPLSFGKAK